MNSKRHYKQLLLSVVVLILPSVLIVVLGWKNFKNDQNSHAQEVVKSNIAEKNSAQSKIGKEALDRLQNIKDQEIGNSGTHDPAVKFVGWAEGSQLVLPFEMDPRAKAFHDEIGQNGFADKINEAFVADLQNHLDQAAGLYHTLSLTAGNDSLRAYARQKQAQVLRKFGKQADADAIWRDLMTLPSNLVDADGDSFAFIAAFALVDTAGGEVFARVSRDLESPTALTLVQSSQLLDILKSLKNSDKAALREDAKSAFDNISGRITQLQQARTELEQDPQLAQLRKDFPNLGVTEKSWQSYGQSGDALLISKMPAGASLRPLVIAVRRQNIFDAVLASGKAGLPFRIAGAGDSGESLDEQHFPELKIIFPPVNVRAAGLNLQQSLYVPAILLLVSLNLLGGYLLWRDTRREVQVAEMRSQFVSSVSHELKTPLTSIRMFAEILQMKETTDAQTRGECLDTIVNESERLTRLLNNVLDFSRIEHGQKSYHKETTRLGEVVTAAVKTMQYPLAEQGFDLRMSVDDQMPPMEVDRDALKQAVLNLLTNAMKYSGQSRGIELRLFPKNGSAMIQVSDHGIGIPEGEQSRIFEKFYRARVPENRNISGTGLGLALVAHIAEAHGGSVQVESSLVWEAHSPSAFRFMQEVHHESGIGR